MTEIFIDNTDYLNSVNLLRGIIPNGIYKLAENYPQRAVHNEYVLVFYKDWFVCLHKTAFNENKKHYSIKSLENSIKINGYPRMYSIAINLNYFIKEVEGRKYIHISEPRATGVWTKFEDLLEE